MSIIDIINNPTFLSVTGMIITIIIYFKQLQRKELSYKIISFSPLLSRKDGLVQKLQVLYEGKQISDPHVAIVRIANTGNLPIKSTDFESNMSLNFDVKTQVFSAEILKKTPQNLEANLEFTPSHVLLKPTLLNKHDSITITMLTSSKDTIQIDARLAGIKEVREWKGGPIARFMNQYFFHHLLWDSYC